MTTLNEMSQVSLPARTFVAYIGGDSDVDRKGIPTGTIGVLTEEYNHGDAVAHVWYGTPYNQQVDTWAVTLALVESNEEEPAIKSKIRFIFPLGHHMIVETTTQFSPGTIIKIHDPKETKPKTYRVYAVELGDNQTYDQLAYLLSTRDNDLATVDLTTD